MLIDKRRKPLNPNVPEMTNGNKPTDGGHLLLSQQEAESIRENDPIAAKYIRRFLGSEEFINNIPRFCLWLKDSTSEDRIKSPEIKRRVDAVKSMRLASPKIPTQKLAETPYLFGEIRQKDGAYLAIPEVSSENRSYIPIGYLTNEVASNKIYMLPNANFYYFAILTSTMHNAWMRAVCCRLKSDYSYSNTIVYNNFPWPAFTVGCAPRTNPNQPPSDGAHSAPYNKYIIAIETAAQAILDARRAEETRCAEHGQKCSLAQLYAPNNMPEALRKAHNQLDKAIDAAYGYQGKKDDAARVAFLFERYQEQLARTI